MSRIFVKDFKCQYRSGKANEWNDINPVLGKGEVGLVTDAKDEKWLKIGDGITPWKKLDFKNGPKGNTGHPGVYYGTEEPTDPSHPIWINPENDANDEIIELAKKTAEHTAVEILKETLKTFYPVGSIYIAYNHTDPSTLFGGTWVRIQNAFLYATTADGVIDGTVKGESEHTLTVDEMPSHNHTVNNRKGANVGDYWNSPPTTSNDGTAQNSVSSMVNYAGGGQPHNNMPPYIEVSMWRRTA